MDRNFTLTTKLDYPDGRSETSVVCVADGQPGNVSTQISYSGRDSGDSSNSARPDSEISKIGFTEDGFLYVISHSDVGAEITIHYDITRESLGLAGNAELPVDAMDFLG